MSIYTIYIGTNKVNGKPYIGFDSNWPKRPKDHLKESQNSKWPSYNTKFHRAIRKYGFDAFEWKILFQDEGDEEFGNIVLNEIEPYFIAAYDSYKSGYNSTKGGDGIIGYEGFWKGKTFSEETRRKMSESRKGRKHSEESKRKRSEALKGRCTSPCTPEIAAKISAANKGKPKPKGFAEKVSQAMKGRTFSAEHRRNLSEAMKSRSKNQTPIENRAI